MPVRFQVDPDFYDHPKVDGMSDAAFALWVRAGSYSAAKHTDGFVSDGVVTNTLRYERTVADELVRHRLWRRVRGGFQYHQWDDRNLTRERVEAERRADRERKKAQRAAKNNTPGNARADETNGTTGLGRDGTAQVKGSNVRSDSGRNPTGIQEDSARNPGVSVSVSVSESVSGSGRAAEGGSGPPGAEPPPRCEEHLHDQKPPNCGPCADARREYNRWVVAKAKWEREAPKCPKHRGQFAHNCAQCRGEALGVPDDEDP